MTTTFDLVGKIQEDFPNAWHKLPNAFQGWRDAPNDLHLIFEAKEFGSREIGWLHSEGFGIRHEGKDGAKIVVRPYRYSELPEMLDHTTPGKNWRSNRETGLLTGAAAKISTTRRTDCGGDIHVAKSLVDAEAWAASDDLLAKNNLGEDWAILEIRTDEVTGRLIRDPCSQTGYLLEQKCVPAGALSLSKYLSGTKSCHEFRDQSAKI